MKAVNHEGSQEHDDDEVTRLSPRAASAANEDDDVTRLSPRLDGIDDDESTRLSVRAEQVDDEATRFSPRADSAAVDDEATRFSPRADSAAVDDDSTWIAPGRVAHPDDTVRTGPRAAASGVTAQEATQAATPPALGRGRAALPPGMVPRATTTAGSFGAAEPEFRPRAIPTTQSARVDNNPARASAVGTDGVLNPEQAAQRRHIERRKRITTLLVVSCISAALLAGATVGVIMLLRVGT